jgi:DNA-directed RNA polymerase specialized sigma24 family protein
VAALSHPYAQIIRQYFFEGMTLKDIAYELGYPHSTIRVYAMRGIQMLKEIYAGERVVKGGRMARKGRRVI